MAAGLLVPWLSALHAQSAGPYASRSVRAVIDDLRATGVSISYGSNVLTDDLIVEVEPQSREPLALAREVLAAHGLTLRETGGSWLVVRAAVAAAAVVVEVRAAGTGLRPVTATVQLDGSAALPVVDGRAELDAVSPGRHVVTVRATGFLSERATIDAVPGDSVTVQMTLLESVPRLDEVTVTASRYDVSEIAPSASQFSRDAIENLTELGDDTLRVARRVPGIAGSEFSARSYVRGGAADEMMVMLDGIELVEPFHLRDYQGVFSAIDQRIVSGLQVYSGGFPATYGDALSGLTVIEPHEPTELAHEIGVSVLHTAALSSGAFAQGRGSWLVSARRSNLADVMEDDLGSPVYHDAFARIGSDIGSKHRLAFNALVFDDDIVLAPEEGADSFDEARSEVLSRQSWLTLDSAWTDALSSRSWVYGNRFEAQRDEAVVGADLVGSVLDQRELESGGVKQQWRYAPSSDRSWLFGYEASRFEATYGYASTAVRRGILAALDPQAPASRAVELDIDSRRYNAYFSGRAQFGERWVAEVGLRWDRQSYSSIRADEQWSPRSSVLVRLGPRTDLRVSHGRFFQAERLVALPVGDGVVDPAGAQDASHSIVGVEHRFSDSLVMRVEAFEKTVDDVRARFENLFDPLALLPELRAGRARIAPDRAEARGVELLLSGGAALPWWVSYSAARADDLIDGMRVPRGWDQRHALGGGVSVDVGRWSVAATYAARSGWPATGLELAAIEGQLAAVIGERNALRLPSLRRLDVRASRDVPLGFGSLRMFVELTNLTGRRNPCCWSYEVGTTLEGAPFLQRRERDGLPLTGNVGVLWEF